MKAQTILRCGDPATLAVREVDAPTAAPGEVLVKVVAGALNPADLKVIWGRDGGAFLHAKRFPLVPGFDVSGVVSAVGAGVASFAVADEVFGFLPYGRGTTQGSLAEYVVMKAEAIAHKPPEVSHAQAAALATAGATALQGLRDDGRLQPGANVLVNGASGGVGSLAVQIARQLGAKTVWATCRAAKADAVKRLGADHVIDYKTTPLHQVGEQFDVVFDAASVSSAAACAPILRRGGSYVTLLPNLGLVGGKLRGVFSGKRCTFVMTKSKTEDLVLLGQWQASGAIAVPVAQLFGFDQTVAAFGALQSGEHVGKLVVMLP